MNKENARKHYLEAISHTPNNWEARYSLGQIYLAEVSWTLLGV